MVAELDGGEFWLPAEFFNDDPNTENNRSHPVEGELFAACVQRSPQPESATETSSEEEASSGELIRRLAHIFLYEDCGFSAYSSKVPATETRRRPVFSGGGRKLPSSIPSPATYPVQMESEWEFLYAAAWEIMRMREMEQEFNGRRIHSPHKKKSYSTREIPFTPFMSIPSLTHEQLQLYQLKRQQLIKQQLTAAWNWQSRSAWPGRSSTNTAMTSPPLPSQLPGRGMKAVRLDVGGSRRPSAGTGVFLPKREDIPSEALKKPASSTALPARSFQTLKLNRVDAPCPEPCAVLYELAPNKCHQQQQHHHFHMPATSPPAPPAVRSPDVLLPTEWTY